jgi:hypothetical protein
MIQRLAWMVAAISFAIGCSSGSDENVGAHQDAGAQLLTVGSACTTNPECGSAPFYCMTDHPGGYCMRNCDIAHGDADCPGEAVCQFDGTKGECHKKCNVNSDCRSPDYVCSPAASDRDNMVSHAFCDAMDMSADGGMNGMTMN